MLNPSETVACNAYYYGMFTRGLHGSILTWRNVVLDFIATVRVTFTGTPSVRCADLC